jgi:hypothetical protein
MLAFIMVVFFLSFPPVSYMHTSSLPLVLHALPITPPWLYHSKYTWRRVQVMKPLFMQLSLTSCHFISPWSKYSPLHPVLRCAKYIFPS